MTTKPLSIRWPAVHGAILIGALLAVPIALPSIGWPWYMCLPLAAYACIVWAVPPLWRTAPRLAVGRLGGAPLLSAVVLSVLTTLVLVTYQAVAQPDVRALAGNLPVTAFGSLAVAGLCFTLINAGLEELVFRGVLFEAMLAEWGTTMAVAVTAAFFGIGHMHGYPPGPAGVVLAVAYGVALGLLRWWSGGLGLVIAAHVCADATIFGILVSTGAFTEAAG